MKLSKSVETVSWEPADEAGSKFLRRVSRLSRVPGPIWGNWSVDQELESTVLFDPIREQLETRKRKM